MGDLSGTLIVYPDGTDKPGVSFKCADGFVSRVVSAVADNNIPDAERVCEILNAHVERVVSFKATAHWLRLRGRIMNIVENDCDHPQPATCEFAECYECGKMADRIANLFETARATLSRQAELLAAARDALEPFAKEANRRRECLGKEDETLAVHRNAYHMMVGNLYTASTTYDAIREELKEPNDEA